MSENVVINDTTYNGVDSLALLRPDGTVVTFYPDAVRYNPQNLSEPQKAQARQNLGVGSVDEVAAEVLARLQTPVFGRVDADKVITLTGALTDGTYAFQYEDEDGEVHPLGSYTKTPQPTYTNLFDPATATLNTRMSSSSSAAKTENGYVMSASIVIPAISVTSNSDTDYIAVPSVMWSNSANLFLGYENNIGLGYCNAGSIKGTVVGNWVKVPICNTWGQAITCNRIIVSLYVKGSAITASDIQDIKIYFNEIPE
jgi:hypothetical protein